MSARSWLGASWLLLIILLVGARRADAAVQATVLGNRLLVSGDGAANAITLRLQPTIATRIEVIDGTLIVGRFTRADFTSIVVSGAGGNDVIVLSGASSPITEPTSIDGGPGDDRITGGAGNDTLSGGAGNDQFFWNPGDGSDVVRGGDGDDTLQFNGDDTSERIEVLENIFIPLGRIHVLRNVGGIALDVATVELLDVRAGGGDDELLAHSPLASLIAIRFEGDIGNDVLQGADGNDLLQGADGDDRIVGGRGNDEISGGPGSNVIELQPGDGNDEIDGEEGEDILLFTGSSANEHITLDLDASDHVRVSRDLDNVVLLLNFIDTVQIETAAGDDTVTVDPGLFGVLLQIDVGDGADVVSTAASTSSVLTVTGGAGSDRLIFDAVNEPMLVSPTTMTPSRGGGFRYVEIEDVQFLRVLGVLPSIAITSPTTNEITSAASPFLSLAGTASDTDGITAIVVKRGIEGAGVTASGSTTWTAPSIPLAPGSNLLIATVIDRHGNEVSDTLTVTLNELTYTMAEGATGSFFDTDILLANPNTVNAPIDITYLKGDGTTVSQGLTLAPLSRATIRVDDIAGLENAEVSATVTSLPALPIVVERTMRWDATGYGAHTEKATDGPATTWFFAEGSQGFFDTYLLLVNPQPTTNTATVTFLLENGAPEIETFTLAPTSRRTIPINSLSDLINRSFGLTVTFAQPGVAERAMYFGAPIFNAGHESAGVNAPSPSWFLAEGATGSFFTTFVLLANPGTTPATATVTFLPESGQAVTKTNVVPAGGRVTVNIADEDPSLVSGAVATAVQATQPILVERAQYWPSTPDRWYEAHNSFGSTSVGTRWGLAEGRVGGPNGYQTFILLANADTTQAAAVRITFLRETGPPVVRTFTVNPTSRLNVQANAIAELNNESFGALIEVTSGPGIFVERAMYSNAQGVVFAAGTNALATRLP